MNYNLDQYLVLGVSMVFTDGPALDDIPLGAELGTVDNDILGSGKDDGPVDGAFDGIFDFTFISVELDTLDGNPFRSNDGTMLKPLLDTSESTKDGTNDGVLHGNLGDILLGAELGTIHGDILGSLGNVISLELSLRYDLVL